MAQLVRRKMLARDRRQLFLVEVEVMCRWILAGLLGTGLALAQATSGQEAASDQDVLSRAIQAHQQGHYPEAIEAYQAFLNAHPDAAPVRSNLGAALVHERRFKEAVEQYQQALSAMPTNDGIRLNLALAYYKMGNIPEAVSEFEALSAVLPPDQPQSRQVKLLLAELYLRQGREERAIPLLSPLADADPNDMAVAYLLGTALLRKGDESAGAAIIDRILRNGDTAEGHMLMAFTHLQANDPKPGLVEVNRAIELNPNLPEAYTVLGRLDYITSDVEGAEAAFRKALSLDPNAFEALLYLGTLMRKQGRFADARPEIERALELRPGDATARYQFAMICSEEGDDQRAADLLEALIKDAPQYTEAHRSLSTIAFRLGRVEEGRAERKIAETLAAQIAARDLERGRSLRK
jgi:tetratricopeptide (TPR) repeat protein